MQSIQHNNHKSVNLFKPISFIIFITFYSPIILAMGCLGMSFIFQNFKGFIYIFWLLVVSITREAILMWSGIDPNGITDKPPICSMAQWKFSHYGASGYSIFLFGFTIVYVCMPMFINKDVNMWIFGGLLAYLLTDIGIRYTEKCITGMVDVFIELLPGAMLGVLITSILYWMGKSDLLFFNEISSNKTFCSMPKKQTFKCSVYKNGELIGSSNS
jgi:hypothetical protein